MTELLLPGGGAGRGAALSGLNMSRYKQCNWQVLLLFDQQRWYCGHTVSPLTRARSSRCRASLNFVQTSTLISTDVLLQKDRKVLDFRPKRNGGSVLQRHVATLFLILSHRRNHFPFRKIAKCWFFFTHWGCGLLSDAMKDDGVCLLCIGPKFTRLTCDTFMTWAAWGRTHRWLIRARTIFCWVTSTLKPVTRKCFDEWG